MKLLKLITACSLFIVYSWPWLSSAQLGVFFTVHRNSYVHVANFMSIILFLIKNNNLVSVLKERNPFLSPAHDYLLQTSQPRQSLVNAHAVY